MNLTRKQAETHVSETLREGGKPRQVRMTSAQIVSRVSSLRTVLDAASMRKRISELRADMEPQEREKAGELDKLREVLGQMAKVVRGSRVTR